jgi:hypothetical protein
MLRKEDVFLRKNKKNDILISILDFKRRNILSLTAE